MGLGNITITKIGSELEGKYENDKMNVDYPKIQWIASENAHKIKIIIPNELFVNEQYNENSLEEIDVYTESYYLNLKDNESVQFIRFGYCRKDSQSQAIYTHK